MACDEKSGSRTLVNFFDTREAAEKARDELVDAGIRQADIALLQPPRAGAGAEGFLEEFEELFLSEEDVLAYSEGLRRGGYVLALHVPDADYRRAADILARNETVDMKARAAQWRSEGWKGTKSEGMPSTGTISAPE